MMTTPNPTFPPAAPAAPTGCYTPAELKAAAAALAAGDFAPGGSVRRAGVGVTSWAPGSALARVTAANSGAGASTVALGVADAASVHRRVRLLEASAPEWGGLAGATFTELGTHAGWRRGHRSDQLLVERLAVPAQVPTDVPAPGAPGSGKAVDLTLLDAGWSTRELLAHPHAWISTAAAELDIIVARAGAAALSQAEVALSHRSLDSTVLVIVGARRWTGYGFASAGPLVRHLHDRDAIAYWPLVRGLSSSLAGGLGPGPLPKPLVLSAHRLLELLRDRLPTICASSTAS